MFKLSQLFGKKDAIQPLLEKAAGLVVESIKLLATTLESLAEPLQDISLFRANRRAVNEVLDHIHADLTHSVVTRLEKEDIEALANGLALIAKSVEKLAEHLLIVQHFAVGLSFHSHNTLLNGSGEEVANMVNLLRSLGNLDIHLVKSCNARLQKFEGEADRLLLTLLKDLYSGQHDAVKVLALRDLLEHLEIVVDRCRDVGNTVTHITLKNS